MSARYRYTAGKDFKMNLKCIFFENLFSSKYLHYNSIILGKFLSYNSSIIFVF